MADAKHVETPYQYSRNNWRNETTEFDFYITGAHCEYEPEDGDPEEVGPKTSCISVAIVHGNETDGGIAEATAAFITNACNAHDDLLAALEQCAEAMGRAAMCGAVRAIPAEHRGWWTDALRTADAVIAKARGT